MGWSPLINQRGGGNTRFFSTPIGKFHVFVLGFLLVSKGKSIEGELISIESLTYPFRFQKEKIN